MRRRSTRYNATHRFTVSAAGLATAASLCLGLGCGGGPVATSLELPKTARQPDGVVLDPEPLVPEAREAASARGVISLKEPLSDAAVRAAIEAFFVPFTSHDAEALDAVLSHAARLLDSRGASSYSIVRDELLRRVTAFGHAGVQRIPIDAVERYDYGDLGARSTHPRPPEMRKGDVLVRVHVTVPHTGNDHLFGDVVVLLFRWEEEPDGAGKARLRVVGFDEEDAR
jgi:hypothetical protein